MRELSLHILDLARNCIEAGATMIELSVTEDVAADRLVIEVRDNGRGMDAQTVARATDAFYTTRSTRRFGLGLALFQATCEQSGGRVDIHSQPGVGTVVQGTMQLSHPDRPPLGNMGAALQALAVEAAGKRLRYRHAVNGATFELDSQAIQQELEDVKLTDPTVLCWLSDHVTRGLQELGSVA